jgi:DOMON domain.
MVCLVCISSAAAAPAADGVISKGEYEHAETFDNGNYQLFWTIFDDRIYVGLQGKTTGWVGIGLKPTQMMKDADIILAGIADEEVYWVDSFSTGNFGPHPADTELGGTDDIVNLSVTEEEGVTIVEFERALDTGDAYDAVLSPGDEVSFIRAMATDDDPAFKHDTPKGKGTVTL